MYDYVEYPPKYGHSFVALYFVFALSHILADSWDFFTHNLLCCFAGSVGYTNHGIFLTFSSQISHKNIIIFVSFFIRDWYILVSKPSEAHSGTYANSDQGFPLNLDLNHMQYAIFIWNPSKDTWFVPLMRNMNYAIIYMYVRKKLSCLWQIHAWFKDKYIGANHPCVCLSVVRPTNWQSGWQVFMGSLFNPLLNEFRNC